MRSLSLISISALATIGCLAASVQAADISPAFKSGLYAGAAAGGSTIRHNVKLFIGGANQNLAATQSSVTGGLFGGYACNLGKVQTALELEGLVAPQKSKLSLSDGDDSVRIKNNVAWGGALRLGYYLAGNALLYGKVGFESQKFDVNVISSKGLNAKAQISAKSTLTAIAPGVGLEIGLSERCTLRGEYRMSFYGKKKFSSPDPTLTSVKIKPRMDRYLLGVSYRLTKS